MRWEGFSSVVLKAPPWPDAWLGRTRADAKRRSSRAALFPISVNFDGSPHPIDVVGIAARESVEHGSVLRIDNKKAADGCLAVVSY